MTTDQTLICACCGAPLPACEAAPAPDGTPTALLYHADFRACVRVALANLAAASPVLRAMLGAPEEETVLR